MLYSVFRPEKGGYDYFETPELMAINADMPAPKLPSETNGVGVPAMEAGRPLPSGAKPVGSGWHARGVIAREGSGLLGLGSVSDVVASPWLWLALGIGAIFIYRERK